jgi:hypothetical protein
MNSGIGTIPQRKKALQASNYFGKTMQKGLPVVFGSQRALCCIQSAFGSNLLVVVLSTRIHRCFHGLRNSESCQEMGHWLETSFHILFFLLKTEVLRF